MDLSSTASTKVRVRKIGLVRTVDTDISAEQMNLLMCSKAMKLKMWGS